MPSETFLTIGVARLLRIPFRLFARRPSVPPNKALILKPCCVSQVMLTTPLLNALSSMYPDARFDWAISDWARPAVVGNPRLSYLISTGPGGVAQSSWKDLQRLVRRIRAENYDTCFVPARSSLLALVPLWARIPQRIGVDIGGRGFAHTYAVKPPPGVRHAAEIYLSLARAFQSVPRQEIPDEVGMSFYPSDSDRKSVARRLEDELDWYGNRPLVILHPGGGRNPVRQFDGLRWPAERFALLANRLLRENDAKLLLIGDREDRRLAEEIAGMTSQVPAVWAGQLNLGELGALTELAALYVGNDAGPTHIATAVGCPTIAVFGPTDPAISGPYAPRGNARSLRRPVEEKRPFSWADGVTVADALAAARELMADGR